MTPEELRRQFPVFSSRAYLYNGALAPAAEPVRQALIDWGARWALDPMGCYEGIDSEIRATKQAFGLLINCDPESVFITDNTSRAANLVVAALSARTGSNVVVDASTYPSARYPWLSMTDHGLRCVSTQGCGDPTDALAQAIDADTVAVTVSHIAPESGYRHDLRVLADAAHAHGALLIVDAAQSTGVVPIDVQADGVDALVTTAMKWMLGPPGVGLGYLSPDLLKNANCQQIGYMGVALPDNEDWPVTELPPMSQTGSRLELGVPALGLLPAVRAGIELVLTVGIRRIEAEVAELVEYSIAGLCERDITVRTPTQPARRGGVIALEYAGADVLADYLRPLGVDIGGYPYGVARVDPHAFNCRDDIDRLFEGFDAFGRRANARPTTEPTA